MARRPPIRRSDLDAFLSRGLKPTSIDVLPDGVRYHFIEGAAPPDDELDAELKEFEARNGQS